MNDCPFISKSSFTRVRQCTYQVLVGTLYIVTPAPKMLPHRDLSPLRMRKHDTWSDGVTSPRSNSRCTAGPLPSAEPLGFYVIASEVQALASAVVCGGSWLLGKEAELSHTSPPDAKHCSPLVTVSSAYPRALRQAEPSVHKSLSRITAERGQQTAPQHAKEVGRPGQPRDTDARGRERKQERGFLGLWAPLASWARCPRGPPAGVIFGLGHVRAWWIR